ncbi:hypothetical protein HII17_11530 [Thalassotalea sp. M1531]|uniref:OmpR/PhoB-type domain-containing protein n=1 Tax=Thalassotalea algicola TaxID=2716224 RepID=A0A7Y0LDK7_9GAMM|nr:winged helix-turn-helix domain-containing protein [Thalassotalea algicola]NMP32202.1 hypothetical protein [Thalassotalea algicola]
MKFRLSNGVVYEPAAQALTKENENTPPIKLDNLEAMLLSFFIQHSQQVLHKQTLMDLWPTSIVMEHSLMRVISSLRKKLGDNPEQAKFIKTVPRRGYQFIGSVEQLPTEKVNKQPVKDEAWLNYRLLFLLCALVILAASYFWLTNTTAHNLAEEQTVTPVVFVDFETKKSDISVNPSGNWLLYLAENLGGSKLYIRLKRLTDNKHIDLKSSELEILAASWHTDDEILFIAHENQTCKIFKAILNSDQLSPPIPLSNCHQSENTQQIAPAAELYQFSSLLTNNSHGTRDNQFQANTYKFVTSPNRQYLASLSKTETKGTLISLFNTEAIGSPIWTIELEIPLNNVALSNSRLSFINYWGQLTYYDITTKQLIDYQTKFTSSIYSPTTSATNELIVLEGSTEESAIWLHNLKTSENRQLFELSRAKIDMPLFVTENQIAFISDYSGNEQVWLHSLQENSMKQLTHFQLKERVKSFDISLQDNILAIEESTGISIFTFNDAKQPSLVGFIDEGTLPAINDGYIYFVKKQNSTSSIFKYNLYSRTIDLVISEGSYYRLIDTEIIFSKASENGLWRYNNESSVRIPNTQYIPNASTFSVYQKLIIFSHQSTDALDIETGERVNTLTTLNCVSFSLAGHCLQIKNKKIANKIIKLSKVK